MKQRIRLALTVLIVALFMVPLALSTPTALAAGGTYTVTVTFPAQSAGSLFYVEVWGALSSATSGPGSYDGRDFTTIFNQPCPKSWGSMGSGGLAPVLAGLPSPATTVTGYNLTCSSLTVTGSTGAPFINVYVAVGIFASTTNFAVPSDGLNFTDGRCNQEPYQSVAVYPDNKGGYNFYALFNGVGYFAMHVTEQNLDDQPDNRVTHKIAEGKSGQLFPLASRRLHVHPLCEGKTKGMIPDLL